MYPKDRFINTRPHLANNKEELERQWRVFQSEQELQDLFEQAFRASKNAQSAQGLGVAGRARSGDESTNEYIEDGYVENYFE